MSLPILEKYEQESTNLRKSTEKTHLQNISPQVDLPTLNPNQPHAAPESNQELTQNLAGPKPQEDQEKLAEENAAHIEKLRSTAPVEAEKLEAEQKQQAPGIAGEQKEKDKSWEERIGEVFGKLTEGAFWTRVLKFILGGTLIIIGIVFFAKAAGSAEGGGTAPGVTTTQKAGNVIANPARSAAGLVATRNTRNRTQVSSGTRRRVAEGRDREAARKPETDKRGKPLAGGAATARERRRVAERARILAK